MTTCSRKSENIAAVLAGIKDCDVTRLASAEVRSPTRITRKPQTEDSTYLAVPSSAIATQFANRTRRSRYVNLLCRVKINFSRAFSLYLFARKNKPVRVSFPDISNELHTGGNS